MPSYIHTQLALLKSGRVTESEPSEADLFAISGTIDGILVAVNDIHPASLFIFSVHSRDTPKVKETFWI